MEALNRIGGVDKLTDAFRIFEESGELMPVVIPGMMDCLGLAFLQAMPSTINTVKNIIGILDIVLIFYFLF